MSPPRRNTNPACLNWRDSCNVPGISATSMPVLITRWDLRVIGRSRTDRSPAECRRLVAYNWLAIRGGPLFFLSYVKCGRSVPRALLNLSVCCQRDGDLLLLNKGGLLAYTTTS